MTAQRIATEEGSAFLTQQEGKNVSAQMVSLKHWMGCAEVKILNLSFIEENENSLHPILLPTFYVFVEIYELEGHHSVFYQTCDVYKDRLFN